MTTPRLFLFDQNLKSLHGHYLGYATQIAGAAAAHGVRTIVFANSTAIAQSVNLEIVPALNRDYWQQMIPARGMDPHQHLAASSSDLAITITALIEKHAVGPDDVMFFSYANLATAMGVAKACLHVGHRLPRTVLLFRTDWTTQGELAAVGIRAGGTLLRQAFADLSSGEGGSRARFLTDSNLLTEGYREITRFRVQTAPIPVDPGFYQKDPPLLHTPTTLVYLGDARTAKGYLYLPHVAAALEKELASGRLKMVIQSNFNVPGGESGIPEAREALKAFPNVVMLMDPLERNDYIRWMHEADLILLPYQSPLYVQGSSGILAEAICAGVPAIVPSGTWLSEEARLHGAGIAFGSHNAAGVVQAIREALVQLKELRLRVLERRHPYALFHNPDRLAKFVCGEDVLARGHQAHS